MAFLQKNGCADYTTQHRFSDFETLLNSLTYEIGTKNVLLPSLPPKTSFFWGAPSLDDRRMQLLMFINQLALFPEVRNSQAFIKFLLN